MVETFLNGRIVLHVGDSRDVLKTIADGSIDSVVTDPPYTINFMGKAWDTGEAVNDPSFWAECLRVLKPGGHVVAFSGTRTYHRMACAIEDAGFEVRDMLSWLYGSGFPKSHDVSKGIDKAAGAERKIVGRRHDADKLKFGGKHEGWDRPWMHDPEAVERCQSITAPATNSAIEWQGWGTALKPACEPICLGRKPLTGTVAANVLEHSTGAINIDGCRVESEGGQARIGEASQDRRYTEKGSTNFAAKPGPRGGDPSGRWPANIIHDGSEEVMAAFPQTSSGELLPHHKKSGEGLSGSSTFAIRDRTGEAAAVYGDSGSAARFFYTAKADSDDRLGSKHPTVKPVDLMQWLCRLVTPRGGTILDPFAGTGTTGEAAFREGFNAVLIEREAEYQADIRRRMALCMAGPAERARESIKARVGDLPFEPGTLFA